MRVGFAGVRQVRFELSTPYKVALLTMTQFDPFVVELRDQDGRAGFGEALIVPGYTTETVEGSWRVCRELCEAVLGREIGEARRIAGARIGSSVGAASAVLAALDMLAGHPVLTPAKDVSVPLLAPLHAEDPAELREEIDRKLQEGFRTLKVKVGFDWACDLDRVEVIQQHVAGRATLRLDANQGYDSADGIAFASRLAPQGIELFEQPCAMQDWAANAAVAAQSTVPVMLDESIYDVGDIERAAGIGGVGFVKLKLKKMGSVDMLLDGLQRIRQLGMTPVLGDGVSLDLGCWMESCVAAEAIDNAGEMNGFLKTREGIFENPLAFSRGSVHIPAGYAPRLDRGKLERATLRASQHSFTTSTVIA